MSDGIDLSDELARLLARQRIPPSTVYMDGSHNPRPSEIRDAKRFIEDLVQPTITEQADALAEATSAYLEQVELVGRMADRLNARDAALAARDATIESLRAALAPFAAEWDAEEPWTDTQSHCMFVPWGDVRRAAALLDAPDRFDEAVPVDEFIANVRAKMEGTDG